MRLLSLIAGLFAVLAVNLTLADDTANVLYKPVLKHEDWAPIHYKAYDMKGYYLTPQQVLKLLQQLQKVYAPFSNEETNGRKEKVNKLLDVTKMDPRRCTRTYMHEFNELVRYNSVYRRTMMPYLTYHFINFLSLCEDEALQHNVPLIKQEYRSEIKDLVRYIATLEIDGVAPGYEGIGVVKRYYAHAITGILVYLENKSGIKLDEHFVGRDSGKQKLQELFENDVLEMCVAWVKATDPVDALKTYDVQLTLTDDEKRWVTYGRLCRFILEEKEDILLKMSYQFKGTYERNKSKKSKFGLRKKLANLGLTKSKEETPQ